MSAPSEAAIFAFKILGTGAFIGFGGLALAVIAIYVDRRRVQRRGRGVR